MKKNLLLVFLLLGSFASLAGTPHSTTALPSYQTISSSESSPKAKKSKLATWLIQQIQKKIAAKQQRLEKKKLRLQEKGKLKRVAKIQKTQEGLVTLGIIVMIGGLLAIVVGLILLILSLSTGVYSFFISLGGLGLVVGFVLLLIGLVQ